MLRQIGVHLRSSSVEQSAVVLLQNFKPGSGTMPQLLSHWLVLPPSGLQLCAAPQIFLAWPQLAGFGASHWFVYGLQYSPYVCLRAAQRG